MQIWRQPVSCKLFLTFEQDSKCKQDDSTDLLMTEWKELISLETAPSFHSYDGLKFPVLHWIPSAGWNMEKYYHPLVLPPQDKISKR